jgi:hypothetical protein
MAYRKPEPLRPEEKKQLNNLFDGLLRRLTVTPPVLLDDDPHPKVVVEIHQQLRLRLAEVKRSQPDDPLAWEIRRAINALEDLPVDARPAQIQEVLEARFGKGYFDPK